MPATHLPSLAYQAAHSSSVQSSRTAAAGAPCVHKMKGKERFLHRDARLKPRLVLVVVPTAINILPSYCR